MSLCSLVASGDASNASSCRSPYGSWRTARYLDADNSFSIPRCPALPLLLHHMCTLCYFLCPLLSRAFLPFTSSVQNSGRFAHGFAACTISARRTRVCARTLLPWTIGILSFRLSFLSCRGSTADHTRPTRAWFSSSFSRGSFLPSFPPLPRAFTVLFFIAYSARIV